MESCEYKVCGRDSKRNLNWPDSSRAAARSPLKTLHRRVFRALRTHWGAQTFEFEKAADEISRTAGDGIQLVSVRSIVVQSPWSGLCTPFRANKLGALPASPDSPLGRRFPHLPPALQAAAPSPGNRQYENRDIHKGHPGFHVEVAGFEPAAFWSRTKRATKLRYTSLLEPMRGLEPLTC